MNVFAFTWTDRLCSQREQRSPVDTEKDVGIFSAAAWWTVRMQGTRPEYKKQTHTVHQTMIMFTSPPQWRFFKRKTPFTIQFQSYAAKYLYIIVVN